MVPTFKNGFETIFSHATWYSQKYQTIGKLQTCDYYHTSNSNICAQHIFISKDIRTEKSEDHVLCDFEQTQIKDTDKKHFKQIPVLRLDLMRRSGLKHLSKVISLLRVENNLPFSSICIFECLFVPPVYICSTL